MKEKRRTLLIKAKHEHIIHLMENHFENLHKQVYDKNGLELGQQAYLKWENDGTPDRMKSGSEDEESKDKNFNASMNMDFACLSET